MDIVRMIPGTEKQMLNCDFWIKKIKDPDKIIMTGEEIKEFNRSTFEKADFMCSLSGYKEALSREELINIINEYKIPEKLRFDINGKEASKDFYNPILMNTNKDAIEEINVVKFGIAVRNTRVRAFPSDEGIFDSEEDKEFDLFQETECQAIEPVAILHKSMDDEWYFIQMYNYKGWARSIDIAVGENRKQIFDYLNTDEFLMVTGNRISTQFNQYKKNISRCDFYMGTRIPLESKCIGTVGNQTSALNYAVKLPVRNADGKLEFEDALISVMEEVNYGYLPYTRRNILKQAFKLQGDRYDWGNKNNGRDCSSFIMYVFKTCGIILGRNGDQQEMGEGIFYRIDEESLIHERKMIFKKIKPCAEIFMDGHVMLYIGEEGGEYFMIHDFHRYGTFENDKLVPVDVNEVAVTSTMLFTAKGKRFIEVFTGVGQFEM